MGATMTINLTPAFEFIFFVIIFMLSLDLIFSGLKVIKENTRALKKPKLFGLLMIKYFSRYYDVSQNQNFIVRLMVEPKSLGTRALVIGIMFIVASILMMVDILSRN
jgi:hypothetical protein